MTYFSLKMDLLFNFHLIWWENMDLFSVFPENRTATKFEPFKCQNGWLKFHKLQKMS